MCESVLLWERKTESVWESVCRCHYLATHTQTIFAKAPHISTKEPCICKKHLKTLWKHEHCPVIETLWARRVTTPPHPHTHAALPSWSPSSSCPVAPLPQRYLLKTLSKVRTFSSLSCFLSQNCSPFTTSSLSFFLSQNYSPFTRESDRHKTYHVKYILCKEYYSTLSFFLSQNCSPLRGNLYSFSSTLVLQ